MPRLTLREAISEALREEMQRDPNVFIMGEEVGEWGGTYAVTKGFLEEFKAKDVFVTHRFLKWSSPVPQLVQQWPVCDLSPNS